MLIQIISNTPKWVFVLFLVLLLLGISQMRNSTKSKKRVLILPIVLLLMSIAGVVSAFGKNLMPIAAWAVGYVTFSSLVGQGLANSGNSYNFDTKRFTVVGSTVPLILMMSIFFLKYFVGVSTAIKAEMTTSAAFPLIVSSLYGAFSGAFAGRAWQLIKLTRSP